MTAQPFFSICIPNFNYAHYIDETIRSVLFQEFTDFEIIVVDNASTDNSWSLIQSFENKRIKAFRNAYNIGFAPNLQAATEKACGKFIHVLSADDNMKPGALQAYYNWIIQQDKQDNLFLLSDLEYVDEKSVVYKMESRNRETFTSVQVKMEDYRSREEVEIMNGHEVLKKCLPLLKNPAPFLSVVVSAELWKSVCGFNAVRTIGPDKFFNYKVLSLDPIVAYFPKPLFQYRIHRSANMVSQATNVKQQMDDYLNLLDFKGLFDKLGIDYKRGVSKFLNRVCFETGLRAIEKGNNTQAWRMIGSMLFFPREARLNYRYHLLNLMVRIYPLSKLGLRLLKKLRPAR